MGRAAVAAALFWALAGIAQGQTVVFSEGMGSGKRAFAKVIAGLGDMPVFNQARPPVMDGDDDGRRSPSEVARNLHARLKAADVAPPYIMVGHSLGGSYAMAFALLYPAEVSGLLLIDPRLPSYTPECFAAQQINCEIPPVVLALLPRNQRMEYLGLPEDSRLLASAAKLGDLPVTVLGATVAPPGIPVEWQKFWLEQLAAFTATAPQGHFVPVPGATHMIQATQPQAVIDAIRALHG